MSLITVPVSAGELIDKITILEIKSERIADPAKLANIRRELSLLEETWRGAAGGGPDISDLWTALREVNEQLWDIEDRIRAKESEGVFDDEFIELARSVYLRNDRRAGLKRELNLRVGSELVEEKSYTRYRDD
ncbi:MAG TPA: DUF6165 family protein [Gammaproteobacteria bacterium]|nr:DUF6165 family protein [Gammaproteobacteria bacterium]